MNNTVGLRALKLSDEATGQQLPVIFLYPSQSPARLLDLGPYQLEVAPDGEPADGVAGVVLISHGSGSTPLVYRTLGWSLAAAGYLVAMPEHPGNNRNDNSLADTPDNLRNRPRQLSLILDHLEGTARSGSLGAVTVIGHSMGGYTALACAGATPSAETGQTIAVHADPRVGALVLLAPATPWFQAPGALDAVHVPVLMRSAEHDRLTPAWMTELVRRGLPATTPLDFKQVANADHYAFLSVFPDHMISPGFAPSQDPPGFDRAAFQAQLSAEIISFIKEVRKR